MPGGARPETTSFGNVAAAERPSGISASHGPRSTSSARAPCSSSGGSGEGGSKRRADGREESPQEHLRIVGRPGRIQRLAAGGERVDGRVAGRNPRRRRLDHGQRAEASGRSAAASSEITPP